MERLQGSTSHCTVRLWLCASCSHLHVCASITKQYTMVLAKRRWCYAAWKATVRLAFHWLCFTVVYQPMGSTATEREVSPTLRTLLQEHGTFTLLCCPLSSSWTVMVTSHHDVEVTTGGSRTSVREGGAHRAQAYNGQRDRLCPKGRATGWDGTKPPEAESIYIFILRDRLSLCVLYPSSTFSAARTRALTPAPCWPARAPTVLSPSPYHTADLSRKWKPATAGGFV